MSRWQTELENHPFQVVWNQILEMSKLSDVVNRTVISDVQELARFRKAIKYIDEIIKGCDAELVPKATWDQFFNEATSCHARLSNFNTGQAIGELVAANVHVDNLLAYVRPYMMGMGQTGRALQASLREYSKSIKKNMKHFNSDASGFLEEIESQEAQVTEANKRIAAVDTKISELYSDYFEDEAGGDPSINSQVSDLVAGIIAKNDAIEDYHERIFNGTVEQEAIKTAIDTALVSATEDSAAITRELEESKDELSDLKKFYSEIYGYENEDDEQVTGLKQELVERRKDLDQYEKAQKQKYADLVLQIEELLPGAISAGLASAFRKRKESYGTSITVNTIVFYLGMAAILVAAGYFALPFLESGSVEAGATVGVAKKVLDWEQLGSSLLIRLPIFIPLFWLAVYVSKRRSQAQRLQEEYAHKESVASSYSGFKAQVEELKEDEQQLLKQLLDTAILTLGYNASSTLDGKHGDESPMMQLMERFNPFKNSAGN